jgi:hypothetical protein
VGKDKPRKIDFPRWARYWSKKRTEDFPTQEDIKDTDFQDYLKAALVHLGIDNAEDCEAELLACVVLTIALDYNEAHANGVSDTSYHAAH